MRKRDELVSGCMAKADMDEMTFVLLGRDLAAPSAIRHWIKERVRLGKNIQGDHQLIEAEQCAATMERERPIVTRRHVANAVDKMFSNGAGDTATRLVLTNEVSRDLGGYCREAVVDLLCRHLGVK